MYKRKPSEICKLPLHLKLEKCEQINPTASKSKEVITMSAQINEMENYKTREKTQ